MIALLLAAAIAQGAAPAPPSAAALALARAASDIPPMPAALRQAEAQLVYRLMNTLTRRGPGCDALVPACRAAAERIARDAAPATLAARRALRDGWRAIVIDETMTPDEIAAAMRFAATPAGRSFMRALTVLEKPDEASPALQQRLARAMMAGRDARDDERLFDRFFEATASLPRRKLPPVPPPPRPSPPPASKP